MKLFLITLACLCAVALAGFSVEEESVHYKDDKALTDSTKKAKKNIQRQTLTLADENNKELNKERTDKFKAHGFTKERTDKFNVKNSHKNTLTLNQEQEKDFEKENKKTLRRTKTFDKTRRSVSCSSSCERSRSCSSGGSSSGDCGHKFKKHPKKWCGCHGWGFGSCGWGFGSCGWGDGHCRCGHKRHCRCCPKCFWKIYDSKKSWFNKACKKGAHTVSHISGKLCLCPN